MTAIETSETTRQQVITILGQLAFFRSLTPEQLVRLAGAATCHHFDNGEMLFLEGEDAPTLWIVHEGRVKVYKLSQDGDEYIVHLFGPGDAFNEVAALDGGPTPANAAAISEVTACALNHTAIVELITEDPALALAMIKLTTAHTRTLLSQVEELALYSVTVRVARFLLTHAENPAFSGPDVTRTTIAAHLATTPETVSRALSALERGGSIRYDRREIVVLREDVLRAVAML